MLKTFEAILLLCMSMLLFGLCACSDSGPAPEDLPEPDVKVVESVEKISTNFDTAASQRMAAVIGKNRALIEGDRLWCFAFDEEDYIVASETDTDENDDAIYVQKDKAESFESGILESRYEELSEEDNKRIDDLIAEINSNNEE